MKRKGSHNTTVHHVLWDKSWFVTISVRTSTQNYYIRVAGAFDFFKSSPVNPNVWPGVRATGAGFSPREMKLLFPLLPASIQPPEQPRSHGAGDQAFQSCLHQNASLSRRDLSLSSCFEAHASLGRLSEILFAPTDRCDFALPVTGLSQVPKPRDAFHSLGGRAS